MDLSQLSFSPIQILTGLLSAAIALAGSYWIYRRSKRDEEIRWRIENIYESGLEELNAVLDEDQFPGTTRNRQEASFWDDISNWEKLRLNPQLIKQGTRYYRLLESLEKAERKFTPLNQDIVVQFPDDIAKIEGTEVQLLVGGTADFDETESYGENPPEMLLMSSWYGLGAVLEDIDTAILNADSPEEVRDFMVQDEDLDENPYPDEPTIFMGSGLRPEQLSFWEDEFPEWAECLYQAIEEGYVEQYFKAREQEYNTQQEIKETAEELREIMNSEIGSLTTDK
jgi:hypothetical protein